MQPSGFGTANMSHHRAVAEDRRAPLFSVFDHQQQIHHLHYNNAHHLHHRQQQGEAPELQLFQPPRHHPFPHPADPEAGDDICSTFFPLSFKSDLNQIRSGIDKEAVFREREGKAEEEDTSLQMLPRPPHSEFWQSRGDPSFKETFFEPLNSHLTNTKNERRDDAGGRPEPDGRRNGDRRKSSEAELGLEHCNSRPDGMGAKFRPFGELEAICSPTGIDGQAPRKAMKRKRRRKMMGDCELGSLAEFFESLVKQLLSHQEALHRKFVEAVERMDEERMERESEWRRREAAKLDEEAIARAQQQDLAANRDTVIMSYLEKIAGHRASLSTTTDDSGCK